MELIALATRDQQNDSKSKRKDYPRMILAPSPFARPRR
jgi:hypothetical protein